MAVQVVAGLMDGVDLLHDRIGQLVQLRLVRRHEGIPHVQQSANRTTGDFAGDVRLSAANRDRRVAGRRGRCHPHRILTVADDERTAVADRHIGTAVGARHHGDVHEARQRLEHDGLLILQRLGVHTVRGPKGRVQLHELRGERVDLVHAAANLRVGGVCRAIELGRHATERGGQLLPLRQHTTAQRGGGRVRRERTERIEESTQIPVDRTARCSERGFHDAQRVRHGTMLLLGGQRTPQTALDQHIARRLDAADIDRAARPTIGWRHLHQIQQAPGVAIGVDIGDILTGQVEAVLRRVQGVGGIGQTSEETGHQALTSMLGGDDRGEAARPALSYWFWRPWAARVASATWLMAAPRLRQRASARRAARTSASSAGRSASGTCTTLHTAASAVPSSASADTRSSRRASTMALATVSRAHRRRSTARGADAREGLISTL